MNKQNKKHSGRPQREVEYEITANGCWNCISHKSEDGYPQMGRNGKTFTVSRFMWIKHKGQIKNGLFVLHKCDNPLCINPDHLYLGTQADNQRDRSARGRSGNLKLSDSDIHRIRSLEGKVSVKYLAFYYGVTPGHICNIFSRRARKYI